jgi:hypothetical protein
MSAELLLTTTLAPIIALTGVRLWERTPAAGGVTRTNTASVADATSRPRILNVTVYG